MEVHDFVSPQISNRAYQTVRMQFETYRQPPSATIAEHLAEFRRCLDHYCKVRADKASDIYKDSELRLHPIGSLHQAAWKEWTTARQMTCTMPPTLEGVEAALREEEATRILANQKDPNADTASMVAHSTRATGTLTPAPISCSECGATFAPKKTAHHRCDHCRKKFAADKKKRRESRGATGGGDTRVPRTNVRSAHDTEATQRLPAADDDDEDRQAAWASYATTVSTFNT